MKTLVTTTLLCLAGLSPFLEAQEDRIIADQVPVYPLTTCLVSGEPLPSEDSGDIIDLVHEDRLVRLCCKGCDKEFRKDPAAFLVKLDAAVVAAQTSDYPLDTCIVSLEPLGSMGDPIDAIVDGRLYRLCCKGCKKKVTQPGAPYRAALEAAYIEAQVPTYPLDTCVVSGEPLGGMGDTIDVLYGTRLVRLCCKGCKKEFGASPARFLAKLGVRPPAERPHTKLDHGEAGHEDGEHEGH